MLSLDAVAKAEKAITGTNTVPSSTFPKEYRQLAGDSMAERSERTRKSFKSHLCFSGSTATSAAGTN